MPRPTTKVNAEPRLYTTDSDKPPIPCPSRRSLQPILALGYSIFPLMVARQESSTHAQHSAQLVADSSTSVIKTGSITKCFANSPVHPRIARNATGGMQICRDLERPSSLLQVSPSQGVLECRPPLKLMLSPHQYECRPYVSLGTARRVPSHSFRSVASSALPNLVRGHVRTRRSPVCEANCRRLRTVSPLQFSDTFESVAQG